MRHLAGFLTVTFVCAVVGCGGSTEGNDVFDDAPGGEAGEPSNGGFGTGPGGTSSGGRASSGGASGFGGGSGGNAGTATVPPELLDRCDTLCAAEAEAQCPNQDAPEDCALGCRLTVQQPECVDAFNALFDCAENATFTCDPDSRQATAPDCELQSTVAGLCFLTNVPDPTLAAPCQQYCVAAEAAACPNATGPDCALGCQAAGGLIPACTSLWNDYLTCSESAVFYCGDDGDAVPRGCEPDLLLFAACLLQNTQ